MLRSACTADPRGLKKEEEGVDVEAMKCGTGGMCFKSRAMV